MCTRARAHKHLPWWPRAGVGTEKQSCQGLGPYRHLLCQAGERMQEPLKCLDKHRLKTGLPFPCADESAQAGAMLQRPPSGMRLNLSRARTESSDGASLPPAGLPEDGTPWQDQDITGITLDTLHLLSQWLLLAPAACRQAHLPAHANASDCCLEKQRTCKAFEVTYTPSLQRACPGSSTLSPARTPLRYGMMHSRQEAFRELGQHLMRALTTPLPEVLRMAERSDAIACTSSMG